MQAGLIKDIEKSQVVSFDVFDTLLYRLTDTPEEIFDLVGAHFKMKGFRKMRVKAQQEISKKMLRTHEAPHADFDQIYSWLMKKYPECSNWKQIKEYEWQLECCAVVRNDEIYEIYQLAKNHGKTVIAVSDMYFHAGQLKVLLEKCGYIGFDRIYSSADEKATKYEGTLFKTVREKEKVEASQILHVGDNMVSDVQNAQKCGWKTALYKPHNKNLWVKSGEKENYWKEFGCSVGGPIYMGLAAWIMDKYKKSSCKRLYLLSRDGYNLYHVLKNQTDSIRYLYVSRRSLLLAGITELDKESMELLPPYGFGQSVIELLGYMGVSVEEIDVKIAGFCSKEDLIRSNKDKEKFKLLLQKYKKIVLEQCAREREYAKKYFEEEGFWDMPAMIFDCGWNGSSQYLLKRFLRALDHKENYPFLYVGIMENEKSRKQLTNMPYETFLFGKGRGKNIEKIFSQAIVIPELLFGAPHPSVQYYELQGPVFEEAGEENFRNEILEGIQFYIHHMRMFFHICNEAADRSNIVGPLCRLISKPTDLDSQIIGDIENIDGFVKKQDEKKHIGYLTTVQIRKNPRIEIYWVEGILKRSDIKWQVKAFVKCKMLLKKILLRK